MAQLGIDSTQYERTAPQAGPLPPGVYTMTVVRVQQKQTKDGTGVYEEVEFDVSQPTQFGNRKFWDRFNIVNKNPQASQIGKEALADLAKACGIHGIINDDQELLGKTVQARIIVKPSENPKYPNPSNECRKYYPTGVDADAADAKGKGGAANPAPAAAGTRANWGAAPAATQAPQQATATSGAAPWKTA